MKTQQIVKGYLTEALFNLMKKKPFKDITVSELIEKAGVCRASFYRNYLSMEQIIDEYLRNMFLKINSNSQLSRDDLHEGVLRIFKKIENNKERLLILKNNSLLYRLNPCIYESTVFQINAFGAFDNKYQPYFFAGSSTALIIAWIEFGFTDSAEEITKTFFDLLKGYMLDLIL